LLGGLGGLNLAGIGGSINDALNSVSSPLSRALDALGLDNERLLILLIMFVLLSQEDSDKTILLALGYLLF